MKNMNKEFINRLAKLQKIAGENGNSIDQTEIMDCFKGCDLEEEQIDCIYQSLKEQGIEIDDSEQQEDEAVDKVIADAALTDDSTRDYLREISRYPVLSHEEEVALATAVQEGLHSSDPKKIEAGNKARDRLTECNLKLVVSLVKKYIGRGLPMGDLIQEGTIGLMKAVEKYDPQKGYRFSTYASWWIKQTATRALTDQGRIIRIPVHVSERINKFNRIKKEFTEKNGYEPSQNEIAEAMNISVKEAAYLMSISQDAVSLDTKIKEDEDGSLGDFIQDMTTESPSEAVEHTLLKETLFDLLKSLMEREREIIILRFGLDGGTPQSLEEVGNKFHLTRERVRQIEEKALRKLRAPHRVRKLEGFVS